MTRRLLCSLAAAGLLASSAIQAQTTVTSQAAGGTRRVTAAVETRITTGRPYSAEAVTESVQVLADGNRITRTSMTKVYRDSAGRTRRQSFGKGDDPGTIAISDPVAHVSYVLNPDDKVAFRTSGTVAMPATASPSGYARRSGAGGGGSAEGGRGGFGVTAPIPVPSAPPAAMPSGHPTARPLPPPPPPAPAAGAGSGVMMRSGSEPQHRTTEDLGVQNIEGVQATGTRTTTAIPAGQIGNAQEIRIVSEQWFSDELQLLVLTKHSDPRSGETTYRLRNILRAEPDPALFTVPADYSLQERRIRQQ